MGGREKLDAGGVCFRRALELRDQKDLTEEVALYRRALELNPDFAEAHNNLGNALRKLGKFDEAVVCLHRALELQPNFAEVYFNLGITFHEQRHLDKAVACYHRALELKPDFAEAHSDLGTLWNKSAISGARKTRFGPRYGTIPALRWRITSWRRSWAEGWRTMIWLSSAVYWRTGR